MKLLFLWFGFYQRQLYAVDKYPDYKALSKPIEEFSEAARKWHQVISQFILPPHHTADKSTHLDVLFADFDKMVEELEVLKH